MIDIPSEQIRNITIEGLSGRVLHIPSEKKSAKKNFFLVYGQHTSHERMYGISQYLSRHGNVYAIDLPGYGGMDSFYSIGKEPTIEAYGHYIYTVMQVLKLEKNIWMVGMSMGFQMMTRMLQLHPQIHPAIDKVFSLVGYTSKHDFAIKQPLWFGFNFMVFFGKTRPGVWIADNVFLNKVSVRIMLSIFAKFKSRMKSVTGEQKDVIEMEAHLWTINDQRTHAQNIWDMFHNWDLTKYNQLPFSLINMTSKQDQYFSDERLNENFAKVYKEHKTLYLDIDAHSPSVIGSPDDFEATIPKEVRKMVEK